MANTLTSLIPDIYAALGVVSRELVGFIPSVARDATADRVAANQSVRIPLAPANTSAGTITPAMSLPSSADQTIANTALTITRQYYAPFSWTGEEQYSMNAGPGFLNLKQQQIAQAIRAIVNQMETDIFTAAYQGASRAYGSAATTPCGTAGDWTDVSNVRRILDDNGCPLTDRQLVVSTATGANIRGKQAQFYMTNNADILRQGVLIDVNGFTIRESGQITAHTKGTMSGASTNSAGYAVGATSITLHAVGTGTFVTGDVVTWDSGVNKYVASSATANVSGGVLYLNDPGVKTALGTTSSAITITANYTPNVAFHRNAILLATRLPALPEGGDQADDRITVVDPNSGIAFEIASYPGYRMKVYHVMACWGVKVLNSRHIATLLG